MTKRLLTAQAAAEMEIFHLLGSVGSFGSTSSEISRLFPAISTTRASRMLVKMERQGVVKRCLKLDPKSHSDWVRIDGYCVWWLKCPAAT